VAGTSIRSCKRAGKYIDIHTHLGTFYWGKPLLADELVRMMDRHAPRIGSFLTD